MAIGNQIRANEHYIEGDEPFDAIVKNTIEILKRELKEDSGQKLKYLRRNIDVVEDDPMLIPKPPLIAVEWIDWNENITTMGMKYPQTVELNNGVDIYFYHSEVINKIRKKEIRGALWEIARILRRNSNLNGLSSKGALIIGGRFAYRRRNKKLYQGGLIRLQVSLLDQTRRGIT